jgi:hypothetical protein
MDYRYRRKIFTASPKRLLKYGETVIYNSRLTVLGLDKLNILFMFFSEIENIIIHTVSESYHHDGEGEIYKLLVYIVYTNEHGEKEILKCMFECEYWDSTDPEIYLNPIITPDTTIILEATQQVKNIKKPICKYITKEELYKYFLEEDEYNEEDIYNEEEYTYTEEEYAYHVEEKDIN